ncbi:hypothetical protein L9F63_011757, partial [Diploptera punctata]
MENKSENDIDDDIDIEDPDIDTSEDQVIDCSSDNQALETSSENKITKSSSRNQSLESNSEHQSFKPCLEDDDLNNFSENVAAKFDSDNENIKSVSDDQDTKSKSTNVSISESINEDNKNDEEVKELDKENDIQSDPSCLNPTDGEFKTPEEIVQDKDDKTEVNDVQLEEKVAHNENKPATVDNKEDPDAAATPPILSEGNSPTNMKRWSLEDGRVATPLPLPYQTANFQQQPSVPYLGQFVQPIVNSPYIPYRVPSRYCLKPPEFNSITTQTDVDYEEEIKRLSISENKLKTEIAEHIKTKLHRKTPRISTDAETTKRIKLELELSKVKKSKDEEMSLLNKKFNEFEEKFKTERLKLLEDYEKTNSEMIRNIIATSGQKVKELEDEINQYKQLILKMMMESRRLKIGTHKEKCTEMLGALRRSEKFLSDFSTSNEISELIQKWEKHHCAIIDYETKLESEFTSLSKKLRDVTCQDLINKLWATMSTDSDYPNQQITCKLLEERGDILQGTAAALANETNKIMQDAQKSYDSTVTKSEVDKPKTPTALTENISLQNLNEVENKGEENLTLDKNDEDKKVIDLNKMQNGQVNSTYNSTGAPLYQLPYPSSNTGYAQSYLQPSPYFYNAPQQSYGLGMPLQYNPQQGSANEKKLSILSFPCKP